ncbi:MAG: CbtB-domain containing protein [Hyphomicrobiales bacterium]|nr:CbtB-domain containing protein [Hyphomicrobiales bacterium]MCP5374150.1 CbtB-domain containing protein [Hyphomicrobiales bacterium]
MNTKTTHIEKIWSRQLAQRVAPAMAAMLLGVFLVTGIGFAHPDTIHNAAHDSRHSFAFPCH